MYSLIAQYRPGLRGSSEGEVAPHASRLSVLAIDIVDVIRKLNRLISGPCPQGSQGPQAPLVLYVARPLGIAALQNFLASDGSRSKFRLNFTYYVRIKLCHILTDKNHENTPT